MSASRRLVLTSLLDDRRLSVAILGAGAAHVALTAAGLGGWPCPFYHATGWPCPGCGLGRACVLLLRGEWQAALRLHAYAPVVLAALTILGAGLVVRGKARDGLRKVVAWMEGRMWLSAALLVGLPVYWLLRLMLDESHWQLLVS